LPAARGHVTNRRSGTKETVMASDEDRAMADMMRAALSGDEAAYTAFLRRAAALTRRAVTRRLKSALPSGIEDVVQETLLAVHLKRHTWRSDEPILPWLVTIARYKAIDACRRRGVRVEVPIEDFAEVLAGPDETGAMEETQQMELAVGMLSDGQQRVVKSIALEGLSIKETAAALEMKETAVRVAFHRGLSTIAQRFGRQT
jgi:RNA polymerase sigma-70 factor, ECF subfamily